MTNEPYTREEFEKFARIAKGGNGYVEKRMIATIRNLYQMIDELIEERENTWNTVVRNNEDV